MENERTAANLGTGPELACTQLQARMEKGLSVSFRFVAIVGVRMRVSDAVAPLTSRTELLRIFDIRQLRVIKGKRYGTIAGRGGVAFLADA